MTDKEKLEKLKKLADAMYYAAQYLTTDALRLHKAMEEYHQFVINEYHNEEPVSEDLEKYINELSKQFPEVSFAKLSRIAVRVAKWQKEQMRAKSIDATCFGFQGAALFTFRLPAGSYLVGSKVKVIVIKEE